jgi:hypothetical protein
MAQTEHLPIYKAAYDLCLYFEQLVRGFSRYHKYSLGQDLRDGARRVLELIVRANATSPARSVRDTSSPTCARWTAWNRAVRCAPSSPSGVRTVRAL